MVKWIILTALIISGGVLGYLYIQLEKGNLNSILPLPPQTHSVQVFDGYNDGVHRYDGEIRLPHSCYTVDISAAPDRKFANTVHIALVAKDKMLDYSLCAQIPTAYPFEEVFDGPEDMSVRLTLNGNDVPVHVEKTTWVNPKGNTVTPVE